jgi:hypothetical protein
MGWVYGMHGREDVRTIFWWGNAGGREGLEDLGLAGRIILKWSLNKLG